MTRSPSDVGSRTKRLALSAMMAVIALMFTYVEILIPYSVAVPGVKLGLANLVILVALYRLDLKYAIAINLLRILLAGVLFTSPYAMLFSLAGGMVSVLCMWLLKKTDLFSMIGVSMAGGVAHNLGQIVIAAVLVSNVKMLTYFPVLIFTGMASGILIGIVAYIIERRLPRGLM